MKNKIKLSETQKDVVLKLQSGEVLHSITGINTRCFWHKSMRYVSIATICKLQKIGMVELGGKYVTLTDAGLQLDLANCYK